ncbi:hypothetical protein [Streptomyces sp. NPDC017529]|uniref:hypothetical protein n=1 Tax=Streptomyces sp. NPDC017529 TaxID=3365000 RepID=UPI00378B312A
MPRIPAAAVLAVVTAAAATGCVTVVHRPAHESLRPRPALPAPSVEPIGPEVSRHPPHERPTTPSGPAARRPAPVRTPAPAAQEAERARPAPAAKGKAAGRDGARGKHRSPKARRYGLPFPRAKERGLPQAPGLCALGREYGRWQDDDRADLICRDVYGG